MKTKRIITATILSAGLIMGSTSGAFASDRRAEHKSNHESDRRAEHKTGHQGENKPVPTAAAYAVRLAVYNAALANFDAATMLNKSGHGANSGLPSFPD